MNKPPAFQFYAADFLVDARVKLMSLEERGAYVTLLAHAWIEGPLPRELPRLAKLCDVSVADMERIWPAIAPCWAAADDSITNPRLEKERQKQAQYRKQQSHKALTRQASSQLASAEPPSSSLSSSLSSKSKTKPHAARVAKPVSDDWVPPFAHAWEARFQGTVPWQRIGHAIKPLREKHADVEILERWKRFLAQARPGVSTAEGFAQTFGDWQGISAAPGISKDVALRRAFNAGLKVVDEKRIPREGFASEGQFKRWLDLELARQDDAT